MPDDRHLTRRKLDRAKRALREALKVAEGVNSHHGAECWAELPSRDAQEEAELLSHTVGEVRSVVEEFERELRVTP